MVEDIKSNKNAAIFYEVATVLNNAVCEKHNIKLRIKYLQKILATINSFCQQYCNV